MSPSRFQLEGPSLAEVSARVLAEYGPRARIIAAEAVTTGGISGFFAQRHYEVTVEVPDDSAQDAHEFDLPARAGIAALLDDADSADLGVISEPTPPALSTASVDFQAIMADLAFNTAAADAPGATDAPAPLTGAGDLVVVVGLGVDAVRAARQLLGTAGDDALRIAGSIEAERSTIAGVDAGPIARVDDRRDLLAARAAGVQNSTAVTVAYGLEGAAVDYARTEAIRKLNADQVWVAVDASRKETDTARWVSGVQAVVTVEGVIASGRQFTSSSDTVKGLGLPVFWE